MSWKRLLPAAILLVALGAVFYFDLHLYFTFESLKENRETLLGWRNDHFILSILAFIIFYAVSAAISLPGAIWLTILGGFLFGTVGGGFAVVIGATLGAVVIFLAARYAFADYFHSKVGGAIQRMEDGFRKNAFSYLLVLRLVPLFPFWLVNLVPAFLGVSLPVYAISTLLGIIPGTFVYASIGNGLGHIIDEGGTPDLSLIWSPEVLFPLLGLAALSAIPPAYRYVKDRATSS
jgi:uncharacterized membrane protein YdjX (TVP38/TMEM64 family)